MKVIIDRFEGNFAVVELPDRTTAEIPLKLVPDAKEGDVINIEVDSAATQERKKEIDALANKLWAD